MRKEQLPKAKTLSLRNKRLLEKYIGLESKSHEEYYIRTTYKGEPTESEIWYMVNYCIGERPKTAIRNLQIDYELNKKEARAAWVFCNAFPEISHALEFSHTGDFPELLRPEYQLKLKP